MPTLENNIIDTLCNIVQQSEREINVLNTKIYFEKQKLKRSIASNNTTFDNNKEDCIATQGKSDILENLKQKRNINDFLFSPQTEIIHFRNNFHNNLIKTKFEIKPNISTTQLNHLKNFIYTKPFSVIQCDKNIGTAIISNSLLKKIKFIQSSIIIH